MSNLFITSLTESQPTYTGTSFKWDTNGLEIKLKRAYNNVRTFSLNMVRIPRTWLTIHQFVNSRIIIPKSNGTFTNFDIPNGNYTKVELQTFLNTYLSVIDPDPVLHPWSVAYYPATGYDPQDYFEFTVQNWPANLDFTLQFNPILANMLGMPQKVYYPSTGIPNQPRTILSPLLPDWNWVKTIMISVDEFESEDNIKSNVTGGDNVVCVIPIPYNEENENQIIYQPQTIPELYFDKTFTLTNLTFSFLIPTPVGFFKIPFRGQHWLIQCRIETIKSRRENEYQKMNF